MHHEKKVGLSRPSRKTTNNGISSTQGLLDAERALLQETKGELLAVTQASIASTAQAIDFKKRLDAEQAFHRVTRNELSKAMKRTDDLSQTAMMSLVSEQEAHRRTKQELIAVSKRSALAEERAQGLDAAMAGKTDLLQAEQLAHFETKLALQNALKKLSDADALLATSTTLMHDLDAERGAHGRTKQELQNVFYKAAEAEARATSSDASVRGAKTFYDAEKLAHGETKRVLDGLFAKVAKLESSVTETKQELETTGAANRVMFDQTELELKKALTENIQLREERDALHEWRNGMQQHWQRMPA
jgi:hypothetical protein